MNSLSAFPNKDRDGVTSPAARALGLRLADTYARRPPTDAERERISQAYAQLCHTSRTLIHHGVDAQGRTKSVVVFDCFLWVIDQGIPWCFRLPPQRAGGRQPLRNAQPYLRKFEHFLEGKGGLRPEAGPWFLSSFSNAAREVALRWMDQDVRMAFAIAGVDGGAEYQCDWGDNGAQKVRMIKGRHKNVPYLMRIVGAALREVRWAIDRDVRRALWSIHAHDGRLARWVLEAPCDRTRKWRTQALMANRITLPLALQDHFDSRSPLRSLWTPHIDRLTAKVDAGQPLGATLADCLNGRPAVNNIQSAWDPEDDRSLRRVTHAWTGDHVRFLSGRSRGLSVASARQSFQQDLVSMVELARFMAPRRAFLHRSHWHVLSLWSMWLFSWGFTATKDMESFLKGCPLDWDDPFYAELPNQTAMVGDALQMINSKAIQKALFEKLSWRQIVNVAYRIHDLAHGFMVEAEQAIASSAGASNGSLRHMQERWGEVCCWAPSTGGDWIGNGHVVHELTSLAQTQVEGQRMAHCVGNGHYARKAMEGSCRLFSIRHETSGRSVSTFEMGWRQQKRLVVVQHFGVRDRAPTAAAKATLNAWLRQKQCAKGPWGANLKALAFDLEMAQKQAVWSRAHQQTNLKDQVKQRVHADLVRRHPSLFHTPPGSARD